MRKIVIVLFALFLLAGCSEPREQGVGAAIKEKRGQVADTYRAIRKKNIESLTKLRSDAEKEPGIAAMKLVGIAKGVELRFEGDDSPEAKKLTGLFLAAAKKINPDNAETTIAELIEKLKE